MVRYIASAVVALALSVFVSFTAFAGPAEDCRQQLRVGDEEQILKACTAAIRLNGNDAEAYALRGNAYALRLRSKSSAKDLDLALADFDKAIALNAKIPSFYYGRADAYANRASIMGDELTAEKKGYYEKAVAALDQAIGLQPSYAAAYKRRALVNGYLKRQDAMIADYKKVLEYDPNDSITQSMLRAYGVIK